MTDSRRTALGRRANGGQRPAPGRPPGRRPGWRAAFFALALAAIVAGVAWSLLGSRFFVVRTVRVAGGGGLVSPSQVLAVARIPMGAPLIRVNGGAVARRVERIRQVQSAQVSIDWPDAVVIEVRQRSPVFAVAGTAGYALVDSFGVDVRDTARRPRGLPLLTLSGAAAARTGGASTGGTVRFARGSPVVRAAALVLRELPSRVSRQVVAVAASSASDVSVRLANGVVIVWGGPARAAMKQRELALLMRRHASYYDVSSPNTAVTRG